MNKHKNLLLASVSGIALVTASAATSQELIGFWASASFGTATETGEFSGDDFGDAITIFDNMQSFGGEIGANIAGLEGFSVSLGGRQTHGATTSIDDIEDIEDGDQFFGQFATSFAGFFSEDDGDFIDGFFPFDIFDGPDGIFDAYEESSSTLTTIDLSVGYDVPALPGAKVMIGGRRGVMNHAMGFYAADGDFGDYDGLFDEGIMLFETTLAGNGIRLGAEIEVPVGPGLSIQAGAGFSPIHATVTQKVSLIDDIEGEVDAIEWEFAEHVVQMIDATVAVAYEVSPTATVSGGYRIDRLEIPASGCGVGCDSLIFTFEGLFADYTIHF